MNLSLASNISALGIHRNIERFNAAAAEVSCPNDVGRVEPIVEMMVAKHGVQANINAFVAGTRLDRTLLDILA